MPSWVTGMELPQEKQPVQRKPGPVSVLGSRIQGERQLRTDASEPTPDGVNNNSPADALGLASSRLDLHIFRF